jgi:phenolic acid decarboxylase
MTAGEQTFDGMERTTKFSFTGMGYESLKVDFERGEEVEFRVRGRVKMIGDEDVKQQTIHLVKVEVDSVSPVSFEEPADPAVEVLDGEGTLLEEGTD